MIVVKNCNCNALSKKLVYKNLKLTYDSYFILFYESFYIYVIKKNCIEKNIFVTP